MRIALTQLEPEWLQHVERGHKRITTMAEADGLLFLCPLCYQRNGGNVGTHSVICWFEGRVPDDLKPGPGRWTPKGTGFEDLSFVPGKRVHAVSVELLSGCKWHGHIVNGFAT
jgi:hypothetical protein